MFLKLIVFVAVLGVIVMYADSAPIDVPVYSSDQEEWDKFKIDFKKTYDSPEEEAKRFEIFKDNLQRVQEHNEKYSKGEASHIVGINNFADLTHEEFKNRYTGGLQKV